MHEAHSMSGRLQPCAVAGCRTLTLRERCQFHRTGIDARMSTAERVTRMREDRDRQDDPLFDQDQAQSE
jgi:hypothetical protein